MGDWKLLFTTSPSFVFNGGFTGVAATTPGGASFESLNQKLIRTPVGFLEVSLVQPLSAKRRTVKIAPAERSRTKKNCEQRFPSLSRCAMCCAFCLRTRLVTGVLLQVDGAWELQRRADPISKQPKIYLKVTPQSVRYAMLDVRGDRVEKGYGRCVASSAIYAL